MWIREWTLKLPRLVSVLSQITSETLGKLKHSVPRFPNMKSGENNSLTPRSVENDLILRNRLSQCLGK